MYGCKIEILLGTCKEMHWELEEHLGNLIRSHWELDGNIIIKRKKHKQSPPQPLPPSPKK
jgi:hypothetical protein